MTGVVQPSLVAVSVLGFVLMLASALFAVTSWRKIAGSGDGPRPVAPPSGGKNKRRSAASKRGVTERFEDRWRRRRDEQQGN